MPVASILFRSSPNCRYLFTVYSATKVTGQNPIRTGTRGFTTGRMAEEKFKPAKRVAGQKQDVWSIINEAAAASPKQPIVNMGQGFL